MQNEILVVPGTDGQLVLCGVEHIKKEVALPGAVQMKRKKNVSDDIIVRLSKLVFIHGYKYTYREYMRSHRGFISSSNCKNIITKTRFLKVDFFFARIKQKGAS